MLKKIGLTYMEIVEIFKYRKNNDDYLNKVKLY